MKKNRLYLILAFFSFAFFILAIRLFNLTIVQGDRFREFSDNNRIKQIDLDSSRGIIYDRNGKELATNKAVYSLIAYADRFNNVDIEKKNSTLINLIGIFEEEGSNYITRNDFDIYRFTYSNEEDYYKESLLPIEKVVSIIKENELLGQILNYLDTNSNDLIFNPVVKLREYIVLRGKDFPIEVDTTSRIKLDFIKNDVYNNLLNRGVINQSTSAYDYALSLVKDDESFIYYLLDHPLARKIVYDLIKEKNLQSNIDISDIVYSFDLDYLEHKSELKEYSKTITANSNPKDDFLNLVKENALEILLSTAYKTENRLIVPASILISRLEKIGVDSEIVFKVNENDSKVNIDYRSEKNTDENPLNYLIRIANENNLIDEFILDPSLIRLSQSALFASGIYPRIYLSTWEYSYRSDKLDILGKRYEGYDARKLFEVRKERYKVKESNDYLSYALLSLYKTIESQGYLSYIPVTITRNISDRALIRIEESIPKDLGFEISIKSNRVYPNGTLAAHILGYLGKISEDSELLEYVEYKKYSLDDIVGKSGLEESFEDTLRGSKGKKLVYTDVFGTTTEVIEEIASIPGNNLYTTIDINVQREMENILRQNIFSINNSIPYNSYFGPRIVVNAPRARVAASVMIDAKTGEIIAMTSYPSYDPNLFVNGISNHDWRRLNDSDSKDNYAPKPILNNAIQAMTPGSTFKTVVSLAALEKGLNPSDPIYNYGYIELGNQQYNDLIYSDTGGMWGNLDLYDALKVSSNYYFYVLGLGYNPNSPGDNDIKVELEDIESITFRLGLQSKTGIEINIPTESSGYHPSLSGKKAIIKSGLRSLLYDELLKYKKEDIEVSETKLNNDVTTIVSWVDNGPEMSRNEVILELEKMGYYAEMILPGQREGVADMIKYSYLNIANWTESDSVNMSIGQGQNAYTPIQMAQLASIIGNEGKLIKPTLIKNIKNYNNETTIFSNSISIKDTGVDAKHFKHVKEGMSRAALDVDSQRYNFPFLIGSKTGTAELSSMDEDTGKLRVSTSEIAFAPLDSPEVAVYTIIFDGTSSANVSRINTDLIYTYFKYVKRDPNFTNERIGESEESLNDIKNNIEN